MNWLKNYAKFCSMIYNSKAGWNQIEPWLFEKIDFDNAVDRLQEKDKRVIKYYILTGKKLRSFGAASERLALVLEGE